MNPVTREKWAILAPAAVFVAIALVVLACVVAFSGGG